VTVSGIVRALLQADVVRESVESALSDADFSMIPGLDAPLLAALLDRRRAAGLPGVLLAVAPTGRRAEALGAALSDVIPDAEVLHFPAWETLPHERLSPRPRRSDAVWLCCAPSRAGTDDARLS
jgi:transcription-repair coupling factor (superfamily II helicase)